MRLINRAKHFFRMGCDQILVIGGQYVKLINKICVPLGIQM